MSEKISEYTTSVTALASGDLMDVSKLISTSPDVYQSQKLNYSVLLTELNADLSITLQSIYNASTQPQITTSVAKGGVVIRSGQALDTNSLLELKNIAGSSTFVVGGNGIVATGNWQATAIAAAFGGTGQTSYTIGDIIYASNTTAISKLGIGTAGQVLTVSGGGIPTWATASSSNLGSANLTSADDARTFTLKSGGTASQNLAFLNSGGGNLLRLRGDNKIGFLTNTFTDIGGGTSNINFGDTTNPATIAMYFNSNANYIYQAFQMYCGTYKMHNVDGRGRFTWLNSFTGNTDIQFTLDGGGSRITTNSFSTSYWQTGYTHAYNGNPLVVIRTENSLHGEFSMYNSSAQLSLLSSSAGTAGYIYQYSNGVARTLLYTTGGNYFLDKLSTGVAILGTISAQLHVKGSGATSATTTALFENSASVAALKVKDDGYCILRANNAAIASLDLANNEMSFYIDEATNHCVVKVKYSSGTVKTGTFNLT